MLAAVQKNMASIQFLSLVVSMLGGCPSLLGVFLKDFCIPGGGSTGCFSMRSSRFSAAEAEAQGADGYKSITK
ncbi:hypothetical protein RHGRI_025859 [Rhododendron griersonianum]|uniref:Uncharacterized protein n=1 Tax=Rhododendron griersonianum TaxID=479676 RepID=A0AAV6IV47_9ERIC|nr:hypothetical protein RHGRI_025859 [Rhododendron griersonianum]